MKPGRKQPGTVRASTSRYKLLIFLDIEICELETDQLEALAKKTKLVVTTVGPFMHFGEKTLAACANNGTHYLDSTGEVPWVYDMIAKYDALAKKNNSIIIPQIGLDSVPADILAYILAREVHKRYNAACERVIATLYAAKSGISGGTSLTMVELFCNYSLTHLAKSMHPYSLSPVKAKDSMSSPKGSFPHRLFGMLSIPELGGVQTVGLMAGVDECIAHRSWGLYAQAAQSSDDPSLSYGPRFRFNEYMRASNFLAGALIKFALGFGSLLLALPPTRWILAPLIKKFVIQAPGQGPSKESMKNDFLSYKAVGIAEDSKGKVTAKLDVAHGGYATTGLTMSAAAQVILRGRMEETQAGKLGGGILTPATLGTQYVKTLNDFGMKISIDK